VSFVLEYTILGALLFLISLFGMVINRQNIIALLMCVELMLLAVNTNFVTFSHYYHAVSGQIMVFFVLAVAAAESAIGLAIFVLMYRNKATVDLDAMAELKG
jgi:NADH-quinone oxidoreductase subunit K